MILKVKCPNCNNTQKYGPKGNDLKNKSKRCVYCGRTFKIYKNVNDNRISGRC